jgi:GT2 family glycosyltransferase/glycosyltransferase involved in cell wall biosynthesis
MENPIFEAQAAGVVPRQPHSDEGIHLAIDLSQGSALTWVAGELAVALADIGERVSIPRTSALSPTLEERLRPRLSALMTDRPYRTYHIKLNHYWQQFLMQEISGQINAELFVTNYRFRGELQPLDMWSRNLVMNGVRKLPLSSFCDDSLQDLGVPAAQCAVVAPGYSPEIESLYPAGKPSDDDAVRRLLVVTNSHDLYRYGTDILITALAKAYAPQDPVEIHIKDYGASSGSRELRDLIAAQPSFPKVVWHEQFLSKEDLIRLYGEMHLMVSPFRGEGYAMKILDAMAVGLPVMMPTFGGPMEYTPAGGFIPLEFDEVAVGRCYDTDHYLVGPGAYWCQVREDSLVQSLLSYLAHPKTADEAAAVARAHVFGRYTWKNAARSLVQALHRWKAESDTKIAQRRRPATLPLSVIMPTKDRPRELAKALAGYAAQGDQSFEIVIVNDHGNGRAVRELVASFGKALRTRVIDNEGPPGPGAARNLGLKEAEGEIFLVTGDDIIPSPDLIARHRDAHCQHPETEAAFVGKVDWHPDMNRDWFTDHIVGAGGQQFDYRSLCDQQEVPFDRLYTSNVSWKRALTADLEQIFSEAFRYAAYEDVELGYRLSQRGLKLHYLADAVGYHLHPMTARSFFERMRRVGSMRTVLAAMHPRLIGSEGLVFYQELEIERRRRIAANAIAESPAWESTVEPLVTAFEHLDAWAVSDKSLAGAAANHMSELEGRVLPLRSALFDDLCETFERIGQAQEWARELPEQAWAPTWIAMRRLAQRDAKPAISASTPVSQAKKQSRPKKSLLPIAWARAACEWLREAKRRAAAGAGKQFHRNASRLIFESEEKKLTDVDVVWCFANVMGRHPHSAAEINRFLGSCTDFRDLVRQIVATPEFMTRRTTATEGFLYDDSDRVQRTVLAILKRLEPMRSVERQKIRIGKECDGGYVMLDDFDSITAAYSIGICDEVSWDLYMAERGIDVFQYDHTIDALPLQHARFHWSKKGLGAIATADLETLPGLLEMNGHRGRSDLLLKCDIEGCEWEVLAALPAGCLRQFKQIVLEIHYLERLTEPDFSKVVERAVEVLTADHRVVHIHANNHRPYSIVGGVPLPSVLEITLVRAHDTRLEKTDEVFPSPLDTPCYRDRTDFCLGSFRF